MLRNRQYDTVMRARRTVVVPGDPDASQLYQRVKDDEMPPEAPLPKSEKEWIREWIKGGALP